MRNVNYILFLLLLTKIRIDSQLHEKYIFIRDWPCKSMPEGPISHVKLTAFTSDPQEDGKEGKTFTPLPLRKH